ncbi:hypothetical protein N7517_002384 [Penicillium concentricum]|uniref:Ig-like domain-containing protein n=1 Tax=Penicillium concentricum TaxID=293559 RepID=A0A9W9VJG8_9EURO|nr:uncharacterized protein N7517_002384 [Penicillium concentricum]KAJ5384473.1 hypothetical protein N7517_002384 [Penicillium concentricum]
MGSFLVRGWILAALFVQTSLATTILAEPTVTPTPTAVGTHHNQHQHHHHNHHHWSHIPRPMPSRKPCPVPSSSAVLASSVIPTPTSAPVSTPFTKPSVVVSATDSLSTGLGSSSSLVSISGSASDSSTTTVASIPTSTSTGALQSSVASGSSTLESTTSTVFSTRTATITACPTTVPNCPVSSKTTFVTTETILVSTTICPVTETAGPTQTAPASLSTGGSGGSDFTTSTIYTTRTATITACPSSVTNCPLKSKTTHLVTETLVVSTTVCPVADATVTGAVPTKHTTSPSVTEPIGGGEASTLTTSIIFTTITSTVLACPESVTDCPLRSKTSYATTETFPVATTIYPVVANPQATDVIPGYQSGPVHTTTIIVESCSDDDTCTGYTNTIVMTQTNAAEPTAAPSLYTPHRGSGAVSASSTPSWLHSSRPSEIATAAVITPTSAVSPVYTGAASLGTQSSLMQVVGTMMVILLAIYI